MTRIGYVLKVYPRFSETFVVTEILAREELGQDLRIYALRPTTDTRFHPEIARVEAPVSWVPRPRKAAKSPVTMVVLPEPLWVAAITTRGICQSAIAHLLLSKRYIMALMAEAAMGLPPFVPSTVM